MNSGAGAATPLACWASASGACSCASSPASCDLHRRHRPGHAGRADPDPHRQRVHERPRHPVRARPGVHPAEQHRAEHHVITARRPPPAPAPTPGGTPSPGTPPAPAPAPAAAPPAPHPPAAGPAGTPSPSPRTSSSPNGAVGSVTSPSSAGEVPLMLLPRHPQPRLRHEIPERQRRRQPVPLPGQQRRDLPQHHLQAGVVQHQVMDLQQRQPPPGRPARPPHTAAAAAPAPGPSTTRPRPAAPPPAPPPAGQGHLGDRQHRLPPHHLHRLGQPLPGHRRPVDVMPVDHLLQRRQELLQPRPRVKPQHRPTPGTHPGRPAAIR